MGFRPGFRVCRGRCIGSRGIVHIALRTFCISEILRVTLGLEQSYGILCLHFLMITFPLSYTMRPAYPSHPDPSRFHAGPKPPQYATCPQGSLRTPALMYNNECPLPNHIPQTQRKYDTSTASTAIRYRTLLAMETAALAFCVGGLLFWSCPFWLPPPIPDAMAEEMPPLLLSVSELEPEDAPSSVDPVVEGLVAELRPVLVLSLSPLAERVGALSMLWPCRVGESVLPSCSADWEITLVTV